MFINELHYKLVSWGLGTGGWGGGSVIKDWSDIPISPVPHTSPQGQNKKPWEKDRMKQEGMKEGVWKPITVSDI